jgi:hypothetical protein
MLTHATKLRPRLRRQTSIIIDNPEDSLTQSPTETTENNTRSVQDVTATEECNLSAAVPVNQNVNSTVETIPVKVNVDLHDNDVVPDKIDDDESYVIVDDKTIVNEPESEEIPSEKVNTESEESPQNVTKTYGKVEHGGLNALAQALRSSRPVLKSFSNVSLDCLPSPTECTIEDNRTSRTESVGRFKKRKGEEEIEIEIVLLFFNLFSKH